MGCRVLQATPHRLTLGLAMTLGAAGAVAAQAAEGPNREAKVLALLHRIPSLHGALPTTPVAAGTNGHGCFVVTPQFQGLCGMGWEPAFDPELARMLAVELLRIYGLEPKTAVSAPGAVAARLDALDAAAGVGLKLRGLVEARPLPAGGTWPTVLDEPPPRDLDVGEHRALLAAGVRMHTADVQSFWIASSQDRLTTTLCYLASVGAFLNEVTAGDDVDWKGLLPHDARWLTFAQPKPRAGLAITRWGGGCTMVAQRDTEVRLLFDPVRAAASDSGDAARVLAGGGCTVTLQLVGLQAERGSCTIALRQTGADGREREVATSRTELLFAGSAFDAGRPFTVVLLLQPGQYRLGDQAWISGPPPKRR